MAQLKFTKSAVKDLSDIWDYTLKSWSEKQAEKYYRLIIETCSELAKNPQTGKDYADIYPKLQGIKTTKHIIFYRLIDESTIEITRILHERMDLKNRLK